jgi:ABC-type spermidine/putrescine transport system permease subunit II
MINMSEILTNSTLRDLLTSLAVGELNLATGCVWVVIATALSMVGGAIGGMLLAGKDLGYQLAAILGSLFAPAGVIPAIILGLFLLNLFTNF